MRTLVLLLVVLVALVGCQKPPSTDPGTSLEQMVDDASETAGVIELVGAIDRENGTIFLTRADCDRKEGFSHAFYVSNGKNEEVGPAGVTYEGCWTAVGKTRILIDWDHTFKPMMYDVETMRDPDQPKVEAEVKK